eukprot:CAMPEP_0173211686 /NCGR_PEP_ID=MMETSP1141-20130122/24372_1 /TAXON_ID=483371 /ORGANISM="non described non described, Strain CCMP2298" /LENGTH=180 /DNA_ID=CAMNT_0014138601 /DNA_START=75 /DNA_END=613 /DNA_ORIENTATION=+
MVGACSPEGARGVSRQVQSSALLWIFLLLLVLLCTGSAWEDSTPASYSLQILHPQRQGQVVGGLLYFSALLSAYTHDELKINAPPTANTSMQIRLSVGEKTVYAADLVSAEFECNLMDSTLTLGYNNITAAVLVDSILVTSASVGCYLNTTKTGRILDAVLAAHIRPIAHVRIPSSFLLL